MNHINFNGKLFFDNEPVLLASNRGYRYGDGLFETMKLYNGKILFSDYHFERLFEGLSLLKIEIPKLFTAEKLELEIVQICKKNKCDDLARIRLSVFRGNGGLYDDDKGLQYILECWPLPVSVNYLNENGLVIDVFPDAEKSCTKFANLKSANFLPYSMAAIYVKENKINDCLVLNTSGSIADSTIANLFIIKNDIISTPALEEGCIKGTVRRYLIESFRTANYEIQELAISVNDLKNADEVFLTNSINGIRWVRLFRENNYTNNKTIKIYNQFIKTIWA